MPSFVEVQESPASRPTNTSLLDARLAVGRARAAWVSFLARSDLDSALAVVSSLDGYNSPSDLLDSELASMRSWRMHALLRRGRPIAAGMCQEKLEELYGPTRQTRWVAAKLHYFRGDLNAAARCASQALMLPSPGTEHAEDTRHLIHFWADALSGAGQHEAARDLLLSAMDRTRLEVEDVEALRHTVQTPVHLLEFQRVLLPWLRGPEADVRRALYQYGMACRALGLYDEAEAAMRQRFIIGAEALGFGRGRPKAVPGNGWTIDARTTLLNLKAVLDVVGIEFFLVSGTLLGCVREGDILSHDKDIDIGILDATPAQKHKVENAIREAGMFSIRPYIAPGLLRIQHSSGVLADIFWHWTEGSQIIHEGLKSKWWNSAFSLTKTTFLGETFLIPSNVDNYLSENYGNWKQPDKSFDAFSDTPNMLISNEHESVIYYYGKLLQHYHSGNSAKLTKTWRSLRRVRPVDPAVDKIVSPFGFEM